MLQRILQILAIALVLGSQVAFAQSLTDRLNAAFGGSTEEDEILSPEVAFQLTAEVASSELIKLEFQIEDGYYLYRDKFKFSIDEADSRIDQNKVSIPAGKMKEDPAFGKVEINTGDIQLGLPLYRDRSQTEDVRLKVGYQGCKEDSVCYPPITRELTLSLPALIASANASTVDSVVPVTTVKTQSAQDAITDKLKAGNLLLNILAFFGFGLLLSLTPCVFPMIPILSGIIVGQGNDINPRRAFSLSLFYVLAMAITYAVLGVIAGLFHINLQAAFQNPWIISLFSAVFVGLALSMFGFFELQLPASLQTRLNIMSNSQEGGTLKGAAMMGALSAIIVGPCVAPPLAGALLYISQTGNALLGGTALFAMGLGFGVPLLIIGSSAGSLLPKAGAWMDSIKRVFGVVMLAVAIWFLERILPAQVGLLLWSALLIVSAVYLGALDGVDKKAGWSQLWKGLGVVFLIYGLVLIIGAASGGKSVYRPLEALSTGNNTTQTQQHLSFTRIKNIEQLSTAIEKAGEQGKTLMLDFYADWCVVCKEMEEYTFSDPEVQKLLQNTILVQADVTANDAEDRALLKKYDLYGPPAILFFSHNGQEQLPYRVVGFLEASKFARHITELMKI
ncbi:MAG: protein-disulfide reductase DsbD [Gammaproteobacteria bacterium]|nr:protein-disulfide reductase DsbD [Gammaproteobacteria bacterium]